MVPGDQASWYEAHAKELAVTYESLQAAHLHGWMEDLLPAAPALAADIGAGTGRDAAWLAGRGLDVVAVEPSSAMRDQAVPLHAGVQVRWVADSLPDLREVLRMGLSFDLILLSAVWMHVPEAVRPRAFRKLVTLLKPGGMMAITLRMGPAEPERGMLPVSEEEIERLARDHGAFVVRRREQSDELGRKEVRWVQLAVRLPDDGTGALPLFRHVILNDDKSSTYKLALLRCLSRIADGAAGYARNLGDDQVAVPLGLVALYWIRLFKPLLEAGLPQSPRNRGLNELGFVREGFRALAGLSHLDLRVGMIFSGRTAQALHSAMQDGCRTVADMPARHLKYPGGGVVFPVKTWRRLPAPDVITLDEIYLSSFGTLSMPMHLWKSLQRFDAWIEPALVAEWKRLMQGYAEGQGRTLPEQAVALAMTWSDPARDVRIARQRALELMDEGPLHCVWSGRKLQAVIDIDHCFPWAAWPCDHLWNLMPCLPQVNNRKRDRLPDDATLRNARERILQWWDRGYRSDANPALAGRFMNEARAGLPAMPNESDGLEDVFAGLALQRLRLSHDQQVPQWNGAGATATP